MELELITKEDSKSLRSQLICEDWFNALAEECDAIITETVFNARWELIKGYHMLGTRLLEDLPRFEAMGITQSQAVQCVAQHIGKSRRTTYYALQFAREFPDVDQLPMGKNISWHKICTKTLTKNTKKCDEQETDKCEVCEQCGRPY